MDEQLIAILAARPRSTRRRRLICWLREYHWGDMDELGAFCSTCGRPVDPA